MDKLYSISKAAEILDVTPKTLRIWDKENKLKPTLTSGGHRRYRESDINKIIGTETTNEVKQEICATYARVSSQKQKIRGDLDRQSQRLSEYCAKHNLYVRHIIKDCGSGLNDKRQGFAQLTDLAVKGKINKVIIEHKDNMHTIYAQLDKIAPTIKPGRAVKKGYTIGRVDNALKFEVTLKDKHIDPLELINTKNI